MNFSQNFEQEHILRACPEPTGRFLDIGAWHATDKSNTRALWERGWSGVMVEPSPGPFAGLLAAYPPGNGIVLVNAAVTLTGEPVEMWITADAVSTSDPDTWEKWRGIVAYQPEKVLVRGITLESLLVDGDPDFVSIDTEGTSELLLRRLWELGQRPLCICVEHDGRPGEIQAACQGYACVYFSGENIVLVRK
jgi:FkbM family methyltransferase